MSLDYEMRHDILLSQWKRRGKTISDLNELIGVVAGEWKNLKLTCACDATKNQGCSVCEITLRLIDFENERDAEGPQE